MIDELTIASTHSPNQAVVTLCEYAYDPYMADAAAVHAAGEAHMTWAEESPGDWIDRNGIALQYVSGSEDEAHMYVIKWGESEPPPLPGFQERLDNPAADLHAPGMCGFCGNPINAGQGYTVGVAQNAHAPGYGCRQEEAVTDEVRSLAKRGRLRIAGQRVVSA